MSQPAIQTNAPISDSRLQLVTEEVEAMDDLDLGEPDSLALDTYEPAPRRNRGVLVAGAALGGGAIVGGGVLAAGLLAVLGAAALGGGVWLYMSSIEEVPAAAAEVAEEPTDVAGDELAGDADGADLAEDGADEELTDDDPTEEMPARPRRSAAGTGSAPAPAPAAVTPAAPAPPAAPTMPQMAKFITSPPAANVFVDGSLVGRSPMKVELTPGPHTVRIESGRASGEFPIAVADAAGKWCFSVKGKKVLAEGC
jgi:hypothetical protein